MISPAPEAKCAKSVFQIQSPICGVDFSNNMSITQVRVNERKNNLTLPLKLLNHQLPLAWSDHEFPCKISPKTFAPKMFVPHSNLFYEKRSLILWGEETLLIFKSFTISKSSFLTFSIHTMSFQAKLPSHCF